MSNWNISMLIKVAVTFMIILSIAHAQISSRQLLASTLTAQKSMPASIEKGSKEPKPAANKDVKPGSDGNEMKSKDQAIVPKVSVPNIPKADEPKNMKADEKPNPIPMPDPVKKADEKPKTEQMKDKKAEMDVRSDGNKQIKPEAAAKPIDPNESKEKKQKNPGKDQIPTVTISEAVDMMMMTRGTEYRISPFTAFKVKVNNILYQVPDKDNAVLGAGPYGIVVKAQILENNNEQLKRKPELEKGNEVALKLQQDMTSQEKVRNEVKANQILANNPNVAQMYDKSKEGSEKYHIIAMELMQSGIDTQTYHFTLDQIVNMGIQFSGIGKELNAQNWVYLNWNIGNVFLTDGKQFKLIDMGTCQNMKGWDGTLTHAVTMSDWMMYREFDILQQVLEEGKTMDEGCEIMKAKWNKGSLNPIQNIALIDAPGLVWMMVDLFGKTCVVESELCRAAKFYSNVRSRDMKGIAGDKFAWKRVVQESRERLRSILNYELSKKEGLNDDEVYFFYKLSDFMPSVDEVKTSKLNKIGNSNDVWKILIDNLKDIKEHSKANGKAKPGAICDANEVEMDEDEDEDEMDEEVEDEEPISAPIVSKPNVPKADKTKQSGKEDEAKKNEKAKEISQRLKDEIKAKINAKLIKPEKKPKKGNEKMESKQTANQQVTVKVTSNGDGDQDDKTNVHISMGDRLSNLLHLINVRVKRSRKASKKHRT